MNFLNTRLSSLRAFCAVAALSLAAHAQAVTVDFQITKTWSGGYNADVVINNDGAAVNGWALNFNLGHAIKSASRAALSGTDPYTLNSYSYSAAIATGATETVKYTGAANWSASGLKNCVFNGKACTLLVNGKALAASSSSVASSAKPAVSSSSSSAKPVVSSSSSKPAVSSSSAKPVVSSSSSKPAVSSSSSAKPASSSSSKSAIAAATIKVFAGGVSGIEALADPANSTEYRKLGGGLYLHGTGWGKISTAVKTDILKTFSGKPVMVEIGYSETTPQSRLNNYINEYHNRGIRPDFVTCNAFASGNVTTPEKWDAWIKSFRAAGVAETTKILPTFEYQNFPGNIPTLSSNKVSQRDDFQKLITRSGGLVLDTPSAVFFRREQAYRNWVIDAITWAKAHGHTVAVIVSPNSSKQNYDEDALKHFQYLRDQNVMPDVFAVENYSAEDAATYVNIVGNENTPHHQLGLAKLLLGTWIPGLSKP